MNERNRVNEAMQYLYIQMLNDGIMKEDRLQQIQYILDMISIFNDNKLDMIEDIIDNIKKFGYKEEHILALYSKLLTYITKSDSLLDIDYIVGKYNPNKEVDTLIGL
ncbi:hypothetical protein QOZ84_10595 [Romboutsia sedimentorum]|uniref:Uncharacterized protein n=1 Tax=Romboutsia sedimentorum TaxID=1368474 RepID=A0ABT7EAP9_9FIRM|nr:hypothetical protein [Romboutsia sedimentorum]MDK2564000.1 hypothetical protein [Romboutsia sedimentorum]